MFLITFYIVLPIDFGWYNTGVVKLAFKRCNEKFGILLPKLFWPTVRKKIEAEGREFAKILWSLEQFIQTVKGQKKFW